VHLGAREAIGGRSIADAQQLGITIEGIADGG
jgi:hypothetical protein